MRIVNMPECFTEVEQDNFFKSVKISDWSECPSIVLEQMDTELKQFGLQVLIYNFFGDQYVWKIEKRDNN